MATYIHTDDGWVHADPCSRCGNTRFKVEMNETFQTIVSLECGVCGSIIKDGQIVETIDRRTDDL